MSKVMMCTLCGKRLFSYDDYNRKYGSPLKECKKCGAKYIDPRYHEMAVEGIPKDAFSIPSCIIMMVAGALIAWRGIYLFGLHQLGTPDEVQWVLPTTFLVLGIFMVIAGIIEMILIKTGKKARKYEKLYEESCRRMKDRSYAYTLHKLGYNIPDDFFREDL